MILVEEAPVRVQDTELLPESNTFTQMRNWFWDIAKGTPWRHGLARWWMRKRLAGYPPAVTFDSGLIT